MWTLGSESVSDSVMAAHRQAVSAALGFIEDKAATARPRVDGVRLHVATDGWAVAGFVHRTSREGDPQVHTHCLIPNIVRREIDGRCWPRPPCPCTCGPRPPARSTRPSSSAC